MNLSHGKVRFRQFKIHKPFTNHRNNLLQLTQNNQKEEKEFGLKEIRLILRNQESYTLTISTLKLTIQIQSLTLSIINLRKNFGIGILEYKNTIRGEELIISQIKNIIRSFHFRREVINFSLICKRNGKINMKSTYLSYQQIIPSYQKKSKELQTQWGLL